MKTFIIGMFSLALVASSAAWGGGPPEPNMPNTPSLPKLPGSAAICATNNGVIVIVVDKFGNVKARACNDVFESEVTGGLQVKSVGALGTIMKWYDPTGGPDPCVTWVISGTSYTYCW